MGERGRLEGRAKGAQYPLKNYKPFKRGVMLKKWLSVSECIPLKSTTFYTPT